MDEIVVVAAKRTPICKAGRGSFKEMTLDKILLSSVKGCLDSINLDPSLVDECVFGNVLADLGGTIEARAAVLAAGIPLTTPVMTVNRQCASGLEAVDIIASRLKQNKIEIGLAGGFESMTQKSLNINTKLDDQIKNHSEAKKCLIKMGETSEIIAEKYSITRKEADFFACESQIKAYEANESKCFVDEIVPVKVNNKEIHEDEGIRQTTMEGLSKLKPVFREDGISTAGNSSQMSDASAAVILTTRKKANELNLPVLAVFVDYVVVGCDPQEMGIGPSLAVPTLMRRNNLTVQSVDIFEINEAFATQALFCVDKLSIDEKKVNLFGGAIALGHPLGCTGTRLLVTLINILRKKDLKCGVISLCVGTGMGVAAFIKRD